MNKNKGFTLVELMVIISIIGILITILVPIVSIYTNKAKLATTLSLLNQGKNKAEVVLSEENSEDYYGPKILLLPRSSNECYEITSHIFKNGEVKLSCLIKGNVQIDKKILQWYRSDLDGKWYCESNASVKFIPKNCDFVENIVASVGRDSV